MVNFNKVKSEKGVTMLVLVFAVLILTIITSTIVYRAIGSFDVRRYDKMNQDLSLLQRKVSDYYEEHNELPQYMEYENISIPSDKLDPLDNYIYYIIDLDKLSGTKLNFGDDYEKLKSGKSISELKDNLYIINAQTYNIYYVAGVELDGNTYYKLDGTASNIAQVNYTSAPVLKDGMTPVAWNESSSTWENTSKYSADWYDYYAENPKWANAKTDDGSMWVWVPRYEYKTNDNSIETKFISASQVEADDGYIIQSAFRADYLKGGYNEELSGIWIAKYETSMEKQDSNSNWNSFAPTSAVQGDINTSNTVRAVSKANVSSWRYISVNNAYTNALNYNKDLNSHLIKNTEWGAAAYLAYSNYGTKGTEISANLTSYVTGSNVSQSSNGNITGIFDLSGGASEFVSAYYTEAQNASNIVALKNSSNRNVTVYSEDTPFLLGDAMNETKGWNQDLSNGFDLSNPTLVRGGSCADTVGTGIFAYNKDTGTLSEGKGYRMVLAVSNKEQATKVKIDNKEIPIPNGFTVSTNDGEKTLSDGLVIKDSAGNEFVWVSCTVEEYKKAYNLGISYDDVNLYDDKNAEGVKIKELAQISKYGGFYVSRYEAGIPQNRNSAKNEINIPTSIKEKIVWTNISYDNAKASAEQMYKGEEYKSGLITGTQWDVITSKLYSATSDAVSGWGNYSDSSETASLINVGSNANYRNLNIYDFGGNAWEWTQEAYGDANQKIARGGSYKNSSTNYPIEYRKNIDKDTLNIDLGFRIVLYLDITDNSDEANSPDLSDGMIPVKWNGSNWVICSINDSEWYEYKNQISGTDGQSKWANVMLSDGTYKQGQDDKIGTVVANKDLGSMFVWIPRYEYKIDSDNKKIDVKFIPRYQTIVDSDYSYIHPAFTTDLENGGWKHELSGFWVAKYAAGYQNSTAGEETKTVQNSNLKYTEVNNYTSNYLNTSLSTDTNLSYPVFKANTYAYNIISVGDAFQLSREIENASMYGLSNVDSHLEKNSEWGAVAYLTHSQYGVNGSSLSMNEVITNTKNLDNSVYVNNDSSNNTKANIYSVTGYGDSNILNDVNASSTKNMTGVYDLSGCIWEKTAGFYKGGTCAEPRWFTGMITASIPESSEYVTLYTDNNKIGDATNETAGWNNDSSSFCNATEFPLFIRGGRYSNGDITGIFAYDNSDGGPYEIAGFRVCLVKE